MPMHRDCVTVLLCMGHGHVTSNNLICTGHVVPLRDRDRVASHGSRSRSRKEGCVANEMQLVKTDPNLNPNKAKTG